MTYKGTHRTLPQIAQELNVDAVVEGAVLRSGSQVRITAQLIMAVADRQLWAKSYEGDLRLPWSTLGLDEKDQANGLARKAYAERFSPWVLMRPCFNRLRSIPGSRTCFTAWA